MTGIQFIERNGRREYAIVPMPLFTRMAALLEDLGDEMARRDRTRPFLIDTKPDAAGMTRP